MEFVSVLGLIARKKEAERSFHRLRSSIMSSATHDTAREQHLDVVLRETVAEDACHVTIQPFRPMSSPVVVTKFGLLTGRLCEASRLCYFCFMCRKMCA